MPNSNAVRLTGRQWLLVGFVLIVMLLWTPSLWNRVERFTPDTDYRVPYTLSSDYWLYGRYSDLARGQNKVPIIGDSVIWGHYVKPDQTLSHYLNEAVGSERFANLGLDGTHPAALQGLVEHYAGDVTGRTVVVQFNPLWITSAKHDLQTTKEFHFNHPKLVPQFGSKVPCYRASFSARLWAAIETRSDFFSWTAHLKTAYLQGLDLPTWTIQHPYNCPVTALTQVLPEPKNAPPEEPTSWVDRGAKQYPVTWVELESSLQWGFFKHAVERLRDRGANVFVLVGPFNEHTLNEKDAATYVTIKNKIEVWLQSNNIPHLIPSTLPAELYADTSHPLAPGYALLAQELLAEPTFQSVIGTIER